MRYLSAIIAAVGAGAMVKATPQPLADRHINMRSELPEGYRVEPMTWTGIIEAGGPEMSFNGTIDEVTQQIQAVKKDFTWEGLRHDLGLGTTPSTSPQPQGATKRDKVGIICDVQGEGKIGPYTDNVADAQKLLEKNTGTCSVGPGPRVCVAVACTNNAGVWLCNDNTGPIEQPCSSLASYVGDIIGKCGTPWVHGHKTTKGQEFDSGDFNVIVGWKKHC
ncbi:hypothetical protein HD806DRAFT_537173 [Xylariaceae sp. AK1471]|nr:hypothetical protein HD806DRAFT_537173 [Xylariaceae sp. AK1471]